MVEEVLSTSKLNLIKVDIANGSLLRPRRYMACTMRIHRVAYAIEWPIPLCGHCVTHPVASRSASFFTLASSTIVPVNGRCLTSALTDDEEMR